MTSGLVKTTVIVVVVMKPGSVITIVTHIVMKTGSVKTM